MDCENKRYNADTWENFCCWFLKMILPLGVLNNISLLNPPFGLKTSCALDVFMI